MTRKRWIAAAIVTAAGATALLAGKQAPDADIQAGTPAVIRHEPARDVRVRHEFVRIPLPPVAPRLEARAAAPAAPRRARPARAEADDEALLSKARRVLVGDGRYRPEPFPRIK